jgi:hypothetical protein
VIPIESTRVVDDEDEFASDSTLKIRHIDNFRPINRFEEDFFEDMLKREVDLMKSLYYLQILKQPQLK